MKTHLLPCLLVAGCCCFLNVSSIEGQFITPIVRSTTDIVDFNLATTPRYPLVPGYGFYTDPFYQIFWILGNGDYRWIEQARFDGSPPIYLWPHFDHNYLSQITLGNPNNNFEVVALIIDRKSDNMPPSGLIVNPTGAITKHSSTQGEDDYVKYLEPILLPGSDERVRLVNSHVFSPEIGDPFNFIEDNTITVFPLAFSPDQIGKLLFFYNDPLPAADVFEDLTTTYFPRYGNDLFPLAGELIPHQPINGNKYGNGVYNKVIEIEIGFKDLLFDDVVPNREGLQIFHQLTATGGIADGEIYRFMAVLTSVKKRDWDMSTGVGKKNFDNNDDDYASAYVNYSDGSVVTSGSEVLYFVDADSINLAGGEPKDPNSLKVTDIERCRNNSLKYRVSFELIYCNELDNVSEGANILIENSSGFFDCFRKADQNFFEANGGGMLEDDWSLPHPICTNTTLPDSDYDRWDARFWAKDYRLYKFDTNNGSESCATFRFTAITNIQGIHSFLQHGAIKTGVQFKEQDVVCDTYCSISCALDTSCVNLGTVYVPTFTTGPSSYPYYDQDCLLWRNFQTNLSDCEFCCDNLWCFVKKWIHDNKLFFWGTVTLLIGGLLFFIIRNRTNTTN